MEDKGTSYTALTEAPTFTNNKTKPQIKVYKKENKKKIIRKCIQLNDNDYSIKTPSRSMTHGVSMR